MPEETLVLDDHPVGRIQRTLEIFGILYDNDALTLMRRFALAERKPAGYGRTERAVPEEVPYKVRRILEELGPTFIKIGQLLGTRPDLVPQPFVEEFRNLYDATKPAPFEAIRMMVEDQLGQPLEEVFDEFNREPVASASIGQVHRARLKTGEKVAVKVQRPNVEQRVWTDFDIMRPLVRFIENLFAASRVWQPSEHLSEVANMLTRELDYRYEAESQQRMVDNFEGDPHVKIPRVHWRWSGKRVLVLEWIDGIKFSNLDDPRIQALDGPKMAEVITTAMAEQIFEHRFFHADPSPGNLMAIDSQTVAFLDFGAVGKVPQRRADRMFHLIHGFNRSDLPAVTQALVEICNLNREVNFPALEKDVEKVMDYTDREGVNVGDPVVLDMIIEVANTHDMLLPPDFILITRALFQFEGLCKRLDPSYDLNEVLQPYMREYLIRRVLDPEAGREALLDTILTGSELVRSFPTRMNTLLRRLEANDIQFTVQMANHRGSEDKEERRAYRESFTWLVAAILVGTGLVLGFGQSTASLVNFLFFAVVLLLAWAFTMLFLTE